MSSTINITSATLAEDTPKNKVWTLKDLVRGRIQQILDVCSTPGTSGPLERAKNLPLPPLLWSMVVSDRVIMETVDWDHLLLPPPPPICPNCRCSTKRRFLMFCNDMPYEMPTHEKVKRWHKLDTEAKAHYKRKAREESEKRRDTTN